MCVEVENFNHHQVLNKQQAFKTLKTVNDKVKITPILGIIILKKFLARTYNDKTRKYILFQLENQNYIFWVSCYLKVGFY